jgi:hypothetical protein
MAPTKDYALSKSLKIDTGNSYTGQINRLSNSFRGLMNYNGFSFLQASGWNWGKALMSKFLKMPYWNKIFGASL